MDPATDSPTTILNTLKNNFLAQSPGVYENTLKVFGLGLKKYKEKFCDKALIENIFSFLDEKISEKDSINLLRKLEISLCYLGITYPNFEEIAQKQYETICHNFYQYDPLTQVALLETLESDISKPEVLMMSKPIENFFTPIMSFPEMTIRKLLLTFSKLYSRDLLNLEVKLLKNTIAISIQYYNDNVSQMRDFICPIILNIFYNEKIFLFLMNPENNTTFDFLSNIIDIIADNYRISDPDLKKNCLEIFGKIFEYSENYSKEQEEFIGKLVEKVDFEITDKKGSNFDESFEILVSIMYNDFKKHDLPEFEFTFLKCIASVVTNPKITKILLNNYDFVLYLLNRRQKPNEVCLAKFNIIEAITKNKEIFDNMSKEFSTRFSEYVTKGPY